MCIRDRVLPGKKSGIPQYKNTKEKLDSWIKSGIMVSNGRPSIYVYMQEYKIGKSIKTRRGFISLLKIETDEKGKAHPHEKIFKSPKMDRFNLMRETRAHLSPIFTIYKDKNRQADKILSSAVKAKKADVDINFQGTRERLWAISDEEIIRKLSLFMKSQKVFIADGHHRYEASAHLKQYMRKKERPAQNVMPYDYTLAFFLSMQDKGMVILPTHRVIKRLPGNFSFDFMKERLERCFDVTILKSKNTLVDKLEAAYRNKKHAFGFFYDDKFILAVLKEEKILNTIKPSQNHKAWRKLDVNILHQIILSSLFKIKETINGKRNIYYYRDKAEAIKAVKSGNFKMAVFLNPTKIEEVETIAAAGHRMPQKSTYFYPKLLTGMVVHKF